MKSIKLTAVAVLLIAGEAFAASTVSDVVARQRWPWNGKVDIDYTVTGDKTDVDFYATWDGQTTPVLIGTDFQIEAGQHRFEFDPSLSGFAGKTTTGFAVTAYPAGADAHKYLVLDLVNGGYSYLAAPPEGGWTTEHKSTKMVFARIPAGTAVLGDSKAELDYVNMSTADSSFVTAYGERTVTYTSDFYMGIFKFTDAQYEQLTKGSPSSKYSSKTVSYYTLRGSTNADENVNIDWPATKYKVAPDSIVAKLRAKAKDLTLDLSEEEQWEYAARCTTTTIWPNGGTTSESYSVLSNYVNAIAAWWGSGYGTGKSTDYTVGQKDPNAWGLYDICGCGGEWTLNCFPQKNASSVVPRSGRSNNAVDTVGPLHTKAYTDYDARRIMKGSGGAYASAKLWTMLVSQRQLQTPSDSYAGSTRFCIHLKSLDFDEHR